MFDRSDEVAGGRGVCFDEGQCAPRETTQQEISHNRTKKKTKPLLNDVLDFFSEATGQINSSLALHWVHIINVQYHLELRASAFPPSHDGEGRKPSNEPAVTETVRNYLPSGRANVRMGLEAKGSKQADRSGFRHQMRARINQEE
jgi:hypothetical protein